MSFIHLWQILVIMRGWGMDLWATVSFVYLQTDPGRFPTLVDSSAQRQSCLAELHSSVYVWRQTRTPEKWTMGPSLYILYMHTVWDDAYTCTPECVSCTLAAKPSRCHWLSVEPSWDFHCGVKAADRPLFICSLTTHTPTKSVKKCARMLSCPRQQLPWLTSFLSIITNEHIHYVSLMCSLFLGGRFCFFPADESEETAKSRHVPNGPLDELTLNTETLLTCSSKVNSDVSQDYLFKPWQERPVIHWPRSTPSLTSV